MTDETTEPAAVAVAGRDTIRSLIGEWQGTYRLWLEPGAPPTSAATRCTGRPVLDGLFVALDYTWADPNNSQMGSMLLGCSSEGAWEMLLVDTFHTGTSMMFCQGGPDPDVLGSYGPPDEPWGWRTRFDLVSPDELVITAWNITPTGEAVKATEARYAAVS